MSNTNSTTTFPKRNRWIIPPDATDRLRSEILQELEHMPTRWVELSFELVIPADNVELFRAHMFSDNRPSSVELPPSAPIPPFVQRMLPDYFQASGQERYMIEELTYAVRPDRLHNRRARVLQAANETRIEVRVTQETMRGHYMMSPEDQQEYARQIADTFLDLVEFAGRGSAFYYQRQGTPQYRFVLGADGWKRQIGAMRYEDCP